MLALAMVHATAPAPGASGGVPSPAATEDTPAPLPQPESILQPERVLLGATAASAGEGVWAERTTLEFQRADETGQVSRVRETVVVRAFRRAGQVSVRLELGPLRIHAASDGMAGSVVAWHTGDETACVIREFEGPLTLDRLRELAPPMPAPSLELFFGSQPLASIVGDINWQWASRERLGASRVVRLHGDASSQPGQRLLVRLDIDEASGLVRAFEAQTGGQGPGSIISAVAQRIEAGDPDRWGIDTDDRRRLGALAELRARPAAVRVGDPAPDIVLQQVGGGAWAPGLSLEDASPVDPRPRAILFVRVQPDASARADRMQHARVVVERLSREMANLPASIRDPDRPRVHAALLIDLDLFTQDLLDEVAGVVVPESLAGAEHLGATLWGVSAAGAIDRFAPGAGMALILLDPRGRVVLSEVVTTETDARDLALRVTALLLGR